MPSTTPPSVEAPATLGAKEPFVKWTPTENPNSTIIPGKMRSDRQELPDGFTKEEADRAEVQEAKTLASSRSRNARSAGATTAFAAAAATDCMNYWPRPDLWVCGAIRVKYDSLGGPSSFLLWPTSNELVNPDGFGRRQTFQNGPIYWSATGGAHPVVNHFFAAWARKGYEGGYIGYPTTDEIVNPDGIGRRQHFTGAIIYWKFNEAYSIGGAILDKWGQNGYEGGWLGYPISDETVVGPGGQGRMNRFERGVIYWSPTTNAHPVGGGILEVWAHRGYESGSHGYPTSDEYPYNGGVRQDFQHGSIDWNPNWNINLYGPEPAGPGVLQAPQIQQSPDTIDCRMTADPDDYTYGPGSALTLYTEVTCNAVPELLYVTLTMWEWDGENYNKKAEEFYEADLEPDPTTGMWRDRFSVTASCKPAPYEYHVEFEGTGFHGKFDHHMVNSLARWYC